MFKSKYQKNYERTNAEKELRASYGAPPAIVPQSTLPGNLTLPMVPRIPYYPYSAATYPNSTGYYPNGVGAVVPIGGVVPSGYQQYPYQYYAGQQYPYGYGQAMTYAGGNGVLATQPYYPSQNMISYPVGYQHRLIDQPYGYGPRRSYSRRRYNRDYDDYDSDYDVISPHWYNRF